MAREGDKKQGQQEGTTGSKHKVKTFRHIEVPYSLDTPG
jgi:hypothetical protein